MSSSGRTPTWAAVATGLVLGLAGAAAGVAAWNTYGRRAHPADAGPREVAAQVDLFRLASSGHREMFLVPAGPDANGEPVLARAVFPDEDPPRELASLLLANVSPDQPWTVDLDATPLACRRSSDAAWEPLRGLDPSSGAGLRTSEELRLRALGAGVTKVTLEPRSMRRVLVVLPPKCTIADLSGVQWGETRLVRDQLDLERVRRFREDPAAVTTGR